MVVLPRHGTRFVLVQAGGSRGGCGAGGMTADMARQGRVPYAVCRVPWRVRAACDVSLCCCMLPADRRGARRHPPPRPIAPGALGRSNSRWTDRYDTYADIPVPKCAMTGEAKRLRLRSQGRYRLVCKLRFWGWGMGGGLPARAGAKTFLAGCLHCRLKVPGAGLHFSPSK